MTDKKLTDKERAKTIPLESRIEHCNERIKEVFDSYYRRHTGGGEEPLNICVLRDCSKLIYALNDLINRQKAEIERLTTLAKLGNMRANDYRAMRDKAKTARAEAIKEFWNSIPERLNEQREGREEYNKGWNACLDEFWEIRNNLLKEMVGEDND